MGMNVCVQMCVFKFKYTCVRVKGRDQCSNQNCFILGGQGLTLNLEVADLARLTDQQAPGICM